MNYATMKESQLRKRLTEITRQLVIKANNTFITVHKINEGPIALCAYELSQAQVKEIVDDILPGIWENNEIFKFEIGVENWSILSDLIVNFRIIDLRTNNVIVDFDVEQCIKDADGWSEL